MSQVLKLKDAGSKLRQVVESLRKKKEEYILQNDQDEAVAVVMPIESYEFYQAYLREREADFAIFDRVAEAFEDVDPEELQAKIDQATEEVKAKYNAQRRAST